MKKFYFILFIVVFGYLFVSSFRKHEGLESYLSFYTVNLSSLRSEDSGLLEVIKANNLETVEGKNNIRLQINQARIQLKKMDFWLRYLEPVAYRKLNGPLPVEWETEVFEKFEAPYKREGKGLTLAAQYLDEEDIRKDSLLQLIESSLTALDTYAADSITDQLRSHHHLFLCNRLFLLNLAAIYTTGFECPDTAHIIPELKLMLSAATDHYAAFNRAFATTPVKPEYLSLYHAAVQFVSQQPENFSAFDHFTFIRDYINPLFAMNQQMIRDYKVVSRSFVDYSLNKKANSIFDKQLYNGQNEKGIFLRVTDTLVLAEIEKLGKLLFYDPILSGNNKRACVSCHKSTEYFTDTLFATSLQFDKKNPLNRNTPSLVNSVYNHLLMLDGKHISLQDQVKEVISNPLEMNSGEDEILTKIVSCPDYKKAFDKLLKQTPWEEKISIDHITSAITYYYSKFSGYYAPFDEAMNNQTKYTLSEDAKKGFNLFMSKAQCATCHFTPQFNGVKPPYVGSEFEVLGVPSDTSYTNISTDKGRYQVNPAFETLHAFRTGSLRNAAYTAPYMHNGVFKTLDEVVDFYDKGGGAGRGLSVSNQTLSADSLRLTADEKHLLVKFMHSLNERIVFDAPPAQLPLSKNKLLNSRKIGGEY
jgi:cytochrome c peroxidase